MRRSRVRISLEAFLQAETVFSVSAVFPFGVPRNCHNPVSIVSRDSFTSVKMRSSGDVDHRAEEQGPHHMTFEPAWTSHCCYCPSLLPNMIGDEEKSALAATLASEHTLASDATSSSFGPLHERKKDVASSDSLFSTASCFSSYSDVLLGTAFDLILVRSSTTTGERSTSCSDAIYCFDATTAGVGRNIAGGRNITSDLEYNCSSRGYRVELEVDTTMGSPLRFPIQNGKIQSAEDLVLMEDRINTAKEEEQKSGHSAANDKHSELALVTIASALRDGRNRARYLLFHNDDDLIGVAPIHIYSWSSCDRIIIIDIDGTITRSNIRGVVDTVLTEQYQHCHDGVCEFFSSLLAETTNKSESSGTVRAVYLTSRPIGLANTTRKFLSELRQQSQKKSLPDGAMIGFEGTLTQLLMMELVSKNVHDFKSKTLRNQVLRPFSELGRNNDVLLAGFGNTSMDCQGYHDAGLELHKIYWIDKQSTIYCLDEEQKTTRSSPTRRRSDYRKRRGSSFKGYQDASLVSHVLQREEEDRNAVAQPV